jgi:sec-independent protein translocase protein TatA
MPQLGMQEVLIILVVAVIFFGGSKIPQLAKGLGEGIRNFKSAVKSKPKAGDDPGTKA